MGNLLNIFQSYGASLATCHLKQVNAPHRNPSHTGLYSIYLPQMDRRLSSTSCWLYTKMVHLFADNLIAIRPGVEPMTLQSQVQRFNCYTTKRFTIPEMHAQTDLGMLNMFCMFP